jgi:hypothetical protein
VQRLHESRQAGLILLIVFFPTGKDYADAPYPLGLLRPRRQRPRDGRTAEQRDELAPLPP